MSVAHKYRTRRFVNMMGHSVVRQFYRCENCWSRIYEDYIEEVDKLETVNVMDLLKMDKSKLKSVN